MKISENDIEEPFYAKQNVTLALGCYNFKILFYVYSIINNDLMFFTFFFKFMICAIIFIPAFFSRKPACA